MTKTSTNSIFFSSLTTPVDKVALTTLQKGGIVLLPTANLWQVTVRADRYSAVNRMLVNCPVTEGNRPELIFQDRRALLDWFPRLHPKLDTLLSYHGRALTIIAPATHNVADSLVDECGEVAIRVALDASCYNLCKEMGAPLAATLAMGTDEKHPPTRFGKIRSDVLRATNYTVRKRQREDIATQPALRIRLRKGEVEFV